MLNHHAHKLSPSRFLPSQDSKSLTHFATTISCNVNDIEDNGCPVLEASEVPFFMSQFLFKLDPNDNSHFGREKGKKLKPHR